MIKKIRMFVLCVLFQGVGVLFAQHALSLRGSLVDSTDAVIPGATIELDDNAGKKLLVTHSDDMGNFSFPNLSAGRYEVVIPAYASFEISRVPFLLTAALNTVKIKLNLASVTQDVQVTADQNLSTDPSANSDAVILTANDIRKTPVFDQDPVATLTPFLDDASGASGGVTMIVDGIEVKNLNISPSAIQEIHINNDPYGAAYSRPGRGRIEIMTKPGSPQFHGEANFTFRDATFNAKNYFAQMKPPESRRIYEGHLSGPIGHGGRTGFIASVSRQEQDTAVIVNALGPDGVVNQNVQAPNYRTQASGRITHDFSDTHRIAVTYSFRLVSNQNVGVGGLVLPGAGYNHMGREDDIFFTDRLILTPNLINQLQVMLEKDENVNQSTTKTPAVIVNGGFTGGGAQFDQHLTENTIHINEILAWNHGRHYITAGIQLPQFSRRGVDENSNRLGTLQYSSLATYAANTPYVYSIQLGLGRTVYWMNEFGSFLEDQMRINKKIQVTLGVRYDWQSFLGDKNNLAPRLSISYAPDSGKTILRAGTGVFYDRTGGDYPATVKLHDGVTLREVQVQNPTTPLPSGPELDDLPTNLAQFSSHVRSPYSIQYSAGVERRVGKKATLTAEYRGQVQVKAFRSVDVNAPILPASPELSANYPRPDPRYGQIQDIESGGRALVNALDLSFRGDFGHWFTGRAQYAFAHFNNNTGGLSQFPQDQYHLNFEWGRADLDQRHKFNLLGTINPDHWLSLGVAATIYSGTPYTETTGNDDYHTGLGNARPAGVARNTLQGQGTTSFDALYSHDFRVTKETGDEAKVLSAGISAFDVFNHTNYQKYIGTLSSPRFGMPTTASPGRQIQFSLGYRF